MRTDPSRPARLFATLAGGLLIAACGGDGTTPNQSPTASISQPQEGASVVEGQAVDFQGSGSDPEDGTLTGASLRWISSQDGQIGTGGSFSRSDLSVGDHTIRLIATDSDQDADTASISISVADAATPTISSVSPDPLASGGTGTISGENFNPTASGNVVTVGGVRVTVTSASATSLEISIPADACLLAGSVDVVVTVADASSSPFTHSFDPGSVSSLSLDVGDMQLIQDPASFCLRFAESSTSQAYLVGVQSTSESVTSLDSVRLVGIGGPGNTAPSLAPLASPSGGADLASLLQGPTARRMAAHRRAEIRFRERERRVQNDLIARGPPPATSSGPLTIPSDVQVGDTLDLRVTDVEAEELCEEFTELRAVVRVIGTRGVWLEDVDNPSGGYTTTDFQNLSDALDDHIFVADSLYFGAPSDVDGNDRIAVLVTKEVNRTEGLQGFVFSGDLFDQDTQCSASNEGEIYYGVAPDPDGEFGETVAVEDARANNKNVLAHELVHLIQNGVRIFAGLPSQTPWEAEGQAVLGEEVVGHLFAGNEPGQNYGFDVAFDSIGADKIQWYVAPWVDLALYYGVQFPAGGGTSQLSTAPHECSWLDRAEPFGDNDSPCISDRAVYGVPFSLFRWLADHYGPGYPGGEEALITDMVASGSTGYAMLEDLVGVPIEELLAQWAAALYVDDRVVGADPMLTILSWDLVDIESGLIPDARLDPMEETFGDFTRSFQVRGGSSAYIVVSGSSRPATAIRALEPDGSTLRQVMQMWVVRMQ